MENNKGFIALITIIIVLALVLLVGISASLLSISESDMGLEKSQSAETFYLATACAEQALMKLRENPSYSGNEPLNFDSGNCYIFPLEIVGSQGRIVKTSGNAYNQISKIKVEIAAINPVMQITSWQEVSDF